MPWRASPREAGLLVAGYQGAIVGRLSGVPEVFAATAREGIANATAISQKAGDYAEQIIFAANGAFVAGWQQAMWTGVGVMTILVLFVLFRGPSMTPGSMHPANETAAHPGNPSVALTIDGEG